MMATTARVEVTKKIIELVDFPVESIGEESINWNQEWSGRFSEAKRLYSEFTTTFNEPLLQYHPIPQAHLPDTTGVNGGSTPEPLKEQINLVEKSEECKQSSDQKTNDEYDCMNELKPSTTDNVIKKRKIRKLSDIYRDCDDIAAAAADNNELGRANRTCKAAENNNNNNNNKLRKKKHSKYIKKKLGKKCSYCESTRTPQWREGPAGPNSLCNACGLRLKKWNCLDPTLNQIN
ncbi:GATA transcription factor 3-like [Impatiens glandulifera]|uniref:GATA transcription factor 3-like n=1 Tax=Impatiens glandulifera TaxID=253017 RepID=UPI001FB116AE|nr:GATA transcription factor 3-like [Impatiens glandulifera]